MTTEDIKHLKETYEKLSKLCRLYFENSHDTSWQHYSGWEFAPDDSIYLNYTYQDYYYNTDTCTEYGYTLVTLETLLKYEQEQNI